MKLGMEIPTAHLRDLSPLVDYDFVIPHKLEDKRYADFYSERHNVECIMDNGFHELGKPIDWKQLEHYFDALQPDYMVSPDDLSNPLWTMEQAQKAVEKFNPEKLAGNAFGETIDDIYKMIMHYHDLNFGMICFPYRLRQPWWFEDTRIHNAISLLFDRTHFLGGQTAEETSFLAQKFPFASLDTAKPIKWGLQCHYLTDLVSWRGGWKEDYDTFSGAVISSPAQEACVNYNIAYLRKLMA